MVSLQRQPDGVQCGRASASCAPRAPSVKLSARAKQQQMRLIGFSRDESSGPVSSGFQGR